MNEKIAWDQKYAAAKAAGRALPLADRVVYELSMWDVRYTAAKANWKAKQEKKS